MRTTSPVTVGREAEILQLDGALTRLRDGCGEAVFLVGEAGIGKSRLIDHCAGRAVALPLPVLRGRGSTTGAGTPFRPLVEALSSQFRRSGPPGDPELVPYRPALARLVPEWRHTAAPGHPDSVVELAEALLRLLAVIGRTAGCVLALEDLHDADSETVAVVEYLVDNLTQVPVLLVAALRPEPGPALDLACGAERRRVASITAPAPLGRPEVRALAAGCLGVAAAEVPGPVVERLADGGGIPYLVEELLADMIGSNVLHRDGDGWRVAGELAVTVPATVVQSHGQRLDRLPPHLRELLLLAATLGHRFPVDALRLVTGREESDLFAVLRSAVETGLVVPDTTAPEQYAFRHALTAQAVLAGLAPAERAALARRAAAALRPAEPPISAERCQQVATLLVAAGDLPGAALLYAEAGRQALAGGACASAVQLLERARELAAPADRTPVTESLLYALAEAGRLDHALALAETLPAAGTTALDPDRRTALHTRLAWAAVMTERRTEAVTQLAIARALLGEEGRPEQTAALAVIEGHLALHPGQDERLSEVRRRAEEAAEVAERAELPVLACQAWQLLALLAREDGFDTADACLARMLTVAETHALPTWRFEALIRLGANAFMRTGDPGLLEQAREEARELGSIVLTQRTESLLAMNAVLRGEQAKATGIIERWRDSSVRMRNIGTHRYLLLTAATLAAHRGRRREMERELREFRQAGGEDSFLVPLMFGLCRAVCALLEEDRAAAGAELAAGAAWEAEHPNVFYLAGRYGLAPLLAVLAGAAGWDEYAAVAAAPAAELAWNAQFLTLARAILLGRRGQGEQAAQEVERMRRGTTPFPTGRHLGLRLVAEAALADGWGDPVAWLRSAEEYFHALDAPSVASACRVMLRQAGAGGTQRRSGRELIPAALRALGVTPREFEVLVLLAERPGNQDLARRLSISTRTVEKHMASLFQKTGRPDRAALCRLSAELAAGKP
ncbi:AAA family ATPase [Kitasatospora sp. NPDC008050]|uniref:helix-turn-helix transcriptional regulator n=1 Tax=Kitasatospora sp. NPDC008050 TaxID=3364021 RepID=UPI0036E0BC5F